MSMGTNALVEQMIQAGVCDGIDPKNCARALAKLIGMGGKGKGFAERIMGTEFEQWSRQYKKAWEDFERQGLTERPSETNEDGEEDEDWSSLTTRVE